MKPSGVQTEQASRPPAELPTRPPALAGAWYPGEAGELRAALEELFRGVPLRDDIAPRVVAAIAPHAGHRYSGATAAHAAALLAARRPFFKRLVLIGPSHRAQFRGLSIGGYAAYRTPLGSVALDLEAVAKLRSCALVRRVDEAHRLEHALEIHLPLLQYAFGAAMPAIVPILAGEIRPDDYGPLERALRKVLDANTAILISSDFTHYGPDFGYMPFPAAPDGEARLKELNAQAGAAIKTLRREEFERHVAETGDTICGRKAIGLLLDLLPRGAEAVALNYANSGETSGDFRNAVSYLAMAFLAPAVEGGAQRQEAAQDEYTAAQQRALLDLARASALAAAANQAPPDVDALMRDPAMLAPRAVFVTIRKGDGSLRGCIGSLDPGEPLALAVREQAAAAALYDTRFPRLDPREADDLVFEISVLGAPREVAGPAEIDVHRHGIILRSGGRRGIFLPQVAAQLGWDLEKTLDQLAMKAGLPRAAWREPDARFEVFETVAIGK